MMQVRKNSLLLSVRFRSHKFYALKLNRYQKWPITEMGIDSTCVSCEGVFMSTDQRNQFLKLQTSENRITVLRNCV